MRDNLFAESQRIVSFLRQTIKRFYQGDITNSSYLSLLDYEQDNSQGWRIEINLNVVTGETKCVPFT